MQVKSCIMVLGMHRSGTSVLTKLIHDMGVELPSAPLEAHLTDNAEGYWEAREVVQLNNSLLNSLGMDWKSIGPLDETALFSDTTAAIRLKIREYLLGVFSQKIHTVIKDPRMCRLLPVWQATLEELGIGCRVIMVSRAADQVCHSLHKRASVPEIASAAITDQAHALLLWLRYTLEGERHSRQLPRLCLSYENLVSNPEEHARKITGFIENSAGLALTPADSGNINRREYQPSPAPANDIERLCQTLHLLLSDTDSGNAHSAWLDQLYDNALVSIPAAHQQECPGIPVRLLSDLYIKHITGAVPSLLNLPGGKGPATSFRQDTRPVLFISDSPFTRSHIYRVKNPVDALNRRGVPACWNTSSALAGNSGLLKQAVRVIIHRCEWNQDIQTCIEVCRAHGIPMVYDIDDLVFDENIVKQGHIHFINRLPEKERLVWLQKIRLYRRTLDECEQLYCSTEALAQHARHLGYTANVIPNGFSPENMALAEHWRQQHSQIKGDTKRIGYASGTATHEADFATIAEPLADWITDNADWTLTIIGALDVSALRAALPAQQLDIRPLVEPVNLAYELTRLSINLVPLEQNPFCNAKSPLKWYEAALCGVPSIACDNPMYTGLFGDRALGLTARPDEWYAQLSVLTSDSETYTRVQQAALEYCLDNLSADKLAGEYL